MNTELDVRPVCIHCSTTTGQSNRWSHSGCLYWPRRWWWLEEKEGAYFPRGFALACRTEERQRGAAVVASVAQARFSTAPVVAAIAPAHRGARGAKRSTTTVSALRGEWKTQRVGEGALSKLTRGADRWDRLSRSTPDPSARGMPDSSDKSAPPTRARLLAAATGVPESAGDRPAVRSA